MHCFRHYVAVSPISNLMFSFVVASIIVLAKSSGIRMPRRDVFPNEQITAILSRFFLYAFFNCEGENVIFLFCRTLHALPRT